MTRLHALDAVWLEMEKGGPALAPGLLSVIDGPAPPVAQVRAMVAERIERAPGLRWVLDQDSTRAPPAVARRRYARPATPRAGGAHRG